MKAIAALVAITLLLLIGPLAGPAQAAGSTAAGTLVLARLRSALRRSEPSAVDGALLGNALELGDDSVALGIDVVGLVGAGVAVASGASGWR